MASTSSIPLLLVADSAETCERIATALMSAPAYYRTERMTSAELKQKPLQAGLTLALIDQDLHAAKQADVIRQLNAAGIATIALVDARDGMALQEAVLAGAAALIATPFVDAQLWDTVARAAASGARPAVSGAPPAPAGQPAPAQPRKGVVIAVHAPKSGAGASVIAANLAVTLQSRTAHGAVLVEVGEGIGSQAVILNLRSERNLGHLLARFDPDDPELLKEVLTTHSSGLQVLLSPASQSIRIPADLLEEIIELVRKLFEYVVIDLYGTNMPTAVSVVRKSNAALTVIVPEMTSLYYGRQFVEMMESSLPGVALNMILNRSTLASGVPVDAIRRHLKLPIAGAIPDDQVLVTSSVNRGVPFVISHPRSAVARAVQTLAQDLTAGETGSIAERLASAAMAFGPLARLTGRGGKS
ncbi:MAG: hypothetical protein NT169_23960 [Chloroflexi bacterium]|nr:hypothetical protein [Chloroflexota bacterium]